MDKGDMSGSQGNNSSDFVRKLYKMLEDPSYDSIVRWGENGDSFVVLENDKFTKDVLPKHFKHSNFASFVRQLNKYDFHKVRQSNEDNTPSAYGANAWEFKHPEFQANKKDSLDNIRRKAPAPRKTAQPSENENYGAQQMELVNSQLMATQQQLQHLSERYQDLAHGHVVLLQQVVQLQKFVRNHDGVMHRVMGFLHNVDAQRRNSRIGPFAAAMAGGENVANDGAVDDHPASPLQQASELLDEFSVEVLGTKELELMSNQLARDYSTPPNDPSAANIVPQSDPPRQRQIGYGVGNDLETMVYPVGHTNGIDPINSEHINNIPYGLPANGMMPESMPNMLTADPSANVAAARKKSMGESIWGLDKPRILLVEDDGVCARIGSKFLQAFECGVETARDGLEAVSKINNGHNQFDLIFMDIIMPHLDGVSATVCIRETRPDIPIIAMTSNIRADDIDMYFRYGMNDVLPKPFTKEGMLRSLDKHLPHFKKNAPPAGMDPNQSHQVTQAAQQQAFVTPSSTQQAPLGLAMGQLSANVSIKDETSPGKSPASWHSPNQIPGQSPINPNNPQGNMFLQQQQMADASRQQFNMTPTHHPHTTYPPPPQQPNQPQPPRATGHRRVMSDMSGGVVGGVGGPEDHVDKRQRMYPPPPGGFQQ